MKKNEETRDTRRPSSSTLDTGGPSLSCVLGAKEGRPVIEERDMDARELPNMELQELSATAGGAATVTDSLDPRRAAIPLLLLPPLTAEPNQ